MKFENKKTFSFFPDKMSVTTILVTLVDTIHQQLR